MTSKETSLSLQITAEQLNSFCRKIISRSRNTANTHEALTVMEAFVSSFSSDSHAADNYKNTQEIIKSYSAQTREKLMQEKSQQLAKGLLTQNCELLAEVYSSLSRNGFYQNLTTAGNMIEAEKIPAIADWVIQWSDTAKKKAQQASGYPDALDFKKADINIEQYQAMSDIAHFFKNTFST